jgi:hypothetical protein
MISPFQAVFIFSLGWEVRGQVTKRWCIRCTGRKLVLASAQWLLKKQSNWRLRLGMTLIFAGPAMDMIQILGFKNLMRMVQNARTAQKTPMP